MLIDWQIIFQELCDKYAFEIHEWVYIKPNLNGPRLIWWDNFWEEFELAGLNEEKFNYISVKTSFGNTVTFNYYHGFDITKI